MSKDLSPLKVSIQIMAKAPVAGLAKTRLIPALGAEGAARLAKKMLGKILQDSVALITDVQESYLFSVNLWMTPSPDSPSWLSVNIPTGINLYSQRGDDLGERMSYAAAQGLTNADGIILIGSDCPEINTTVLHQAAMALYDHDACLIPSADGGYALLGLRRHEPRLFADIPWSTNKVAELTRQRLLECGMTFSEFYIVHDIDEAEDLIHLPSEWPESKFGNTAV